MYRSKVYGTFGIDGAAFFCVCVCCTTLATTKLTNKKVKSLSVWKHGIDKHQTQWPDTSKSDTDDVYVQKEKIKKNDGTKRQKRAEQLTQNYI